MSERRQSFRRTRLFAALGLLLLLAALLPFAVFLAGLLPEGGRLPQAQAPAQQANLAGSLQVTVLRAVDRQPVEGARIVVTGLAGGESGARSGSDGGVRLEGLDGPVRLEAEFSGERAVAWADAAVDGAIQLAVAPPEDRIGQVKGATGPTQVHLLDARGNVLATTTTDATGHYRLPQHPDAAGVCAAGAVAADGDLLLDKSREVTVALPAPGIGVLEIFGYARAPNGDGRLPVRDRWNVRAGVATGRVPASARLWGIFDGKPFALPRAPTDKPRLPETATLEGRVTGPDGQPVRGAQLIFRPLLFEDFPPPLPATAVRAEEDGHFEAALHRIRYQVEVRAPGHATRIVSVVTPGDPVGIELERGYDLSGQVVDARGLPIPHAKITAIGLPIQEDLRPLARGGCDQKGRFWLRGLGGTEARLHVVAAGYHQTTLEAVHPGARLRILLQRR